MATTTVDSIADRYPSTISVDETLEQKIARYNSPEFKAAVIRHFDRARKRAYDRLVKAGVEVAELPGPTS
jgi:hypothetical protein